MKRAILSVSDKAGLDVFAKGLCERGFEIVSTGGTLKYLNESGVKAVDVQTVTGYPECLNGRVKTLHPALHGGVLALRDNPEHMETLKNLNITEVDVIVVNLYPFKATIKKPGHTLAEAVENIDIGGPSLIRAGAKNYRFVTVVTDPADYDAVLKQMDEGLTEDFNFKMSAKAFAHTAAYDALIAGYLAGKAGLPEFPETLTLTFERKQALRYGENPHQLAAYYTEPVVPAGSIAAAECIHGKELSYNNLGDADGAIAVLREFDEPACVAVKHATPCGVAVADSILNAYKKTYACDPVSIFGGIVAFNRPVDAETAAELHKIFLEIIIAPGYDDDALAILKQKPSLRLLVLDAQAAEQGEKIVKKLSGGLLVQEPDDPADESAGYIVATKTAPTDAQLKDLEFAMRVCKHVKSNAIVVAKDGATLGIGGGCVSRIHAAEGALARSGENAKGAVMASDAFFPFNDVAKACVAAGIAAVIQPGGSKNDADSVAVFDEAGIPMVVTGRRHFRH